MTKGEVMVQYGIKYMSNTNRNEEADEKFVELVKVISAKETSSNNKSKNN